MQAFTHEKLTQWRISRNRKRGGGDPWEIVKYYDIRKYLLIIKTRHVILKVIDSLRFGAFYIFFLLSILVVFLENFIHFFQAVQVISVNLFVTSFILIWISLVSATLLPFSLLILIICVLSFASSLLKKVSNHIDFFKEENFDCQNFVYIYFLLYFASYLYNFLSIFLFSLICCGCF